MKPVTAQTFTKSTLNPYLTTKNKNMNRQISWKTLHNRETKEQVENKLFVGAIICMVVVTAFGHILAII